MRVVSLLPAATEIVAALGAVGRLVGVSHECDFPPEVRSLPRVTRTRIDPALPSGAIDRAMAEAKRTGVSPVEVDDRDRKSTRLNSSHLVISYAVFCLKKKNTTHHSDHVLAIH